MITILDTRPSHLDCAALGNHTVWALCCQHIIECNGFENFHVIPQWHYPDLADMWKEVLGENRVLGPEPNCINIFRGQEIKVISPTRNEHTKARSKPSIIEGTFYETGQYPFKVKEHKLSPPILWNYNPQSRGCLLYPTEYTQANKFYTGEFWISICKHLREMGWTIHFLGSTELQRRGGTRSQGFFRSLCEQVVPDHIWEPELEGLKGAVGQCSIAIGTSTGPTWALLLSSIPQIVLQHFPHNQPLWCVERNQPLFSKQWRIYRDKDISWLDDLESIISKDESMTKLPAVLPAQTDQVYSFHFQHGLGDTANFARMLIMYQRRGFKAENFEISTTPDKEVIIAASGVKVVKKGREKHPWLHPHVNTVLEPGIKGWCGNKTGANIGRNKLPFAGNMEEAWEELKETYLDPENIAGPDQMEWARYIRKKHGQYILLHTIGNSCQPEKSVPLPLHDYFYRELIDHTDCLIILLDWDKRMPYTRHPRLMKSADLTGSHLSIGELAALMAHSTTIGIDSGPLHLATAMNCPAIGLFRPKHYSSSYLLPSRKTLSVVPHNKLISKFTPYKRFEFQIIEVDGSPDIDQEYLKEVARLASAIEYMTVQDDLAEIRIPLIHLHEVTNLCRGSNPHGLSTICDRDHSFKILLRHFQETRIVETGCMRQMEDWKGAGCSTLLFARLVQLVGGEFTSVDINRKNLEFSRKWTKQFTGANIALIESSGVSYLENRMEPIDILYLDSMDTNLEGHAEENLHEFQAAERLLHKESLVCIDDSPGERVSLQDDGIRWTGKGQLTIPYAISKGWKVLFSGYQVILSNFPDGA